MLPRRLSALVDAGLLERRRYSERPPRYEYILTETGPGFSPGDRGEVHFFAYFFLNPNSAVEKSRGRNLGWYGVEKWYRGNDFVGMAWSLVGKRPFQLRRNRKSV